MVLLLMWASWTEGLRGKIVEEGGRAQRDYSWLIDRSQESMSPLDDNSGKGSEAKDQREEVRKDVDFHQQLGELYYESLQEPLEETDVLVPIQREELPIPLKDRAKKRELADRVRHDDLVTVGVDDDEPHGVVVVEDDVEFHSDVFGKDRHHNDANEVPSLPLGEVRAARNTATCKGLKRANPPSSCSKVARRPLQLTEMDGECMRDPPFDLSWMTCDAEIQDWAYRRNPNQSGQNTRWNGVVHVAESPSFKQIVDGFWKEQSGAGFLAMYNKVKRSVDNKLEKREACGSKEVETQVYSKWDTLKDKVLDVRRDIRLRMIRKAEQGQLPKHGMILLREEELVSEAVALDRF